LDRPKSDQEVLWAFYQHLLVPVEAHLEGATEVLIIQHKELFEVQWAALFDSQTWQYLIQRYVLRVAPSLRINGTVCVCVCVCVRVHTHSLTHVCVYIYVYAYTHTHIHTKCKVYLCFHLHPCGAVAISVHLAHCFLCESTLDLLPPTNLP
jgi:hypothetical protein